MIYNSCNAPGPCDCLDCEEINLKKGSNMHKEILPCDSCCPKCGYNDINILYVSKNEEFCDLYGNSFETEFFKKISVNRIIVIKEHLKCTCSKCKYKFLINVKGN